MTRHVLDHPKALRGDAIVMRYARAAQRLSGETSDRKLMSLQRRARGRYDPTARLRAYLRIERGYRA